jgi:trans-4-hydroxy-L-proline dehydratase
MIQQNEATVDVPGLDTPLALELNPDLARLRDAALDYQKETEVTWQPLPALIMAEADAWTNRPADEEWLVWRARRFAARVGAIPLALDDGETIVGKPYLRVPNEEDNARVEKAREAMKEVPAFSGGDTSHFHPNYEKFLAVGIPGILAEIDDHQAALPEGDEKHTFYNATRLAMEAFRDFALRVADKCDAHAAAGDNADHWRKMAQINRDLATDAPKTFHHACQLMFLTHIASWFAEDHCMTCYGRMDRSLIAFYEADLAAGRTTPQEALDLLSMMYIHINNTCPFGLADAVIVGGQDGRGNDVTNALTYLCLAARWATQLCYPTLAIAWHDNTPAELMDFSMRMLRSGINDPAFFNDHIIPEGLRDHGVSAEDSHNYMNSTCVEIKTAGNSNIWVATRYHNCAGTLLEAMESEAVGNCEPAANLDELQDRVKELIAAQVAFTAKGCDDAWWEREQTGCFPFASCLIDDCLSRGIDHDRGGARYHWAENSFVGVANLADALVAIDELVYQNNEMTLTEFYTICKDNYAGQEPLRQRILNQLPKYGNDNDRADMLAKSWTEFLCDTTESHTVGGHRYVPGFFCHVNHAWLGKETDATPDGRLRGDAFADGAGAAQGRDESGPTASVLSTTKWCHKRALGGLVHNLRFSRTMFDSAEQRSAVQTVIETYLRRGGFEIQLNVVSADTLRAAQANPQDYRDLVVRVAGYSDYFTTMMKEVQDEVIARTEHSEA